MNTKLIQTLRSRGRLWKTVALEFAEAMKGKQNDTVIYLRARVRFLEEEDRKLAEELEKGAQP